MMQTLILLSLTEIVPKKKSAAASVQPLMYLYLFFKPGTFPGTVPAGDETPNPGTVPRNRGRVVTLVYSQVSQNEFQTNQQR